MSDRRFALGFRTSGWRRVPLDRCLRTLSDIGYDAVELCLEHPDTAPEEMTAGRCREVARLLTSSGLALSSVSYHGKRDPLALKTQRTARLIDVASGLKDAGVHVDTIVVGSSLPGSSPESARRRFDAVVAILVDACERARGLELRVAMEPEPDTVVAGTHDMDRLLRQGDHPALGVNLDLGHAHLTDGDLVATVHHFASAMAHVHLDDIRGREHRHLVPGDGDLELAAGLGALVEVGYAGALVVDLFDILDDPEGWSRRAFRGARSLPIQLGQPLPAGRT